MRTRPPIRLILPIVLCLVQVSRAQEPPPATGLPPIDPKGIDGALVIVGGGGLPDTIIRRFRELAGGEKARLVVIPTASTYAERDAADPTEAKKRWADRGFTEATILHTRDRLVANSPEFVRPLLDATAVWFDGGDQSRLADAYLGTAVEREVYNVLKRGGVVAGSSAGAAIQTKVMITGGNPVATLGEGFDLLPGSVVDQHFLKRDRKPRLLGILEHYPGLVGFGIDERTALVVTGRRLGVAGDSVVTVLLSGSPSKPAQEMVLRPGEEADLVALRRAARDRLLPAFPSRRSAKPVVENGALVIVGGGGLPQGLVDRFIELAGGPDAPIVVVPTADERPIPDEDDRVPGVRMFKQAGAKQVGVLRGRTRAEIETPEQLEMLRQAKGVWFGGGRQWRFVDCYEGTPVVDLFRDVLKRGGVIGGSSAGATIQGDYLVRGSPLVNTIMMADGYERGFGFLPGVAIDQHFSQRNRFEDLARVIDRYPQLVGLGIDETTAVVVRGSTAEVVGQGSAFFYHRPDGDSSGELVREKVASGGRYDLSSRKPLGPIH